MLPRCLQDVVLPRPLTRKTRRFVGNLRGDFVFKKDWWRIGGGLEADGGDVAEPLGVCSWVSSPLCENLCNDQWNASLVGAGI